MADAAHVSVQIDGQSEEARVQFLIQYGSKQAHLEIEVPRLRADVFERADQEGALIELVKALEAWRSECGHIYTEPRAS